MHWFGNFESYGGKLSITLESYRWLQGYKKNRKIIFHNPRVMWHNFEGYSTWNQSLYSEKIDNCEGYHRSITLRLWSVMTITSSLCHITLGLRVLDECYLNIIFTPVRITPLYSPNISLIITPIINKIIAIQSYPYIN